MNQEATSLRLIEVFILKENDIKKFNIVSLVGIGSATGALCALYLQIYLANHLSQEIFGYITTSIAVCNILSPVAAMGMAGFWPKVFGEEGPNGTRWIAASLRYSFITSSFFYICLTTFIIIYASNQNELIIFILCSAHIFSFISFEAIITGLQVTKKYVQLSIWQLMPHLIRLLSVHVLFTLAVYDLYISASLVYFVTSAFGCLILFLYNKYLFSRTSENNYYNKFQPPVAIKDVIKSAWPFCIASLVFLLHLQMPILVAAYFLGSVPASLIGVVISALSALYLLPSALIQRLLLVKFHHLANSNKAEFYKLIKKSSKILFLSGLIIAIVGCLILDKIIIFLFGGDYHQSGILISIAVFSLPFKFTSLAYDAALSTNSLVTKKNSATFVAICVYVPLLISAALLFEKIGIIISIIIFDILLLSLLKFKFSAVSTEWAPEIRTGR